MVSFVQLIRASHGKRFQARICLGTGLRVLSMPDIAAHICDTWLAKIPADVALACQTTVRDAMGSCAAVLPGPNTVSQTLPEG